MNIVSVGTDSEFFLFDKEGIFVPAYYITEGNKEVHEVIDVHNGVAVHWDNVALEVTCPPLFFTGASSPIVMRHMLIKYFDDIHTTVVRWVASKGLTLSYSPVVHIPKQVMFEDKANVFGCDPDFNIYTMNKNPSPSPMKAGTLRTAGAHFHFGMEVITDYTVANLVKSMDAEMGQFMQMLSSTDKKLELERRGLYGRAGAYRLKEYGVEYRTASPLLYRDTNTLANRVTTAVLRNQQVYHCTNAPLSLDTWVGFINGEELPPSQPPKKSPLEWVTMDIGSALTIENLLDGSANHADD